MAALRRRSCRNQRPAITAAAATQLALTSVSTDSTEPLSYAGSVDAAQILPGAALADCFGAKPLRRRASAALAADPEPRAPRFARPFDQRPEGVEERRLRQTPPLQHADAPGLRRQRIRRLPRRREFRDDDARVGETDDHLRRF